MSEAHRIFLYKDNKVTLSFPYDSEIVEAIKKIDHKERRFDPISKEWTITLSLTNRPAVRDLVKRYGFCNGINDSETQTTRENIDRYIQGRSRLKDVKNFDMQIHALEGDIKLRPYQIEGVNRMCSWPRMINGDDMGLGKSVQTIFAAEIMSKFPCLLICPSSTKYQWGELWRRINPTRRISIIDAGYEKDFSSEVVIINYDILGEKQEYEDKNGEIKWRAVPRYKELCQIHWRYVVVDEIHYTKNSKSLRTKAVKLMTKRAEAVHGLTGTLIENKPVELVTPLDIVGVFKDVFDNWNNFVTRYCDAKETRFGLDTTGASNTLELNRLLRSTCYIRREKRDVLKDLPPLQISLLDMDIDNEKRYSQAEDDFIHYLEKNRFSRRSIDSAMMAEYLVKRNHLRQLSLKGKLKSISQWLEELSEQTGEKILVAGNFSEPLEKLSIQFDAELLDGSKSAQQKRDIIKRWAKNKKQFMIANIQAVGTGTDGLQDACSVICVLDPTDKPSTMDQLISRLERIGQTKPVQVYMLFSSRTIDAHIWEAVKNKKRVTDAVNRGIDISENVDVDDAIVRAYLKRV